MTDTTKKWTEKEVDDVINAPWSCNCIGPQNGKPLCPCQMRGVRVVNGRYVRVEDLGEVKDD